MVTEQGNLKEGEPWSLATSAFPGTFFSRGALSSEPWKEKTPNVVSFAEWVLIGGEPLEKMLLRGIALLNCFSVGEP